MKIEVFQWETYDIRSDEWTRSTRWATAGVVRALGGRTVGAGVEIDTSEMDPALGNMTPRDFTPRAAPASQTPAKGD